MSKGQEKESSRTIPSNLNDTQKEVRDVSNILTILDSPAIKTNPFGANVTGDNSYRRAERIGAALHLITNHVPESEPLRTAIRIGGLRLLGLILELRTGFRTIASEKGQAALAAIRELISLVRYLAVSGFVSTQNVNAIVEALDELGSLIVLSQRSTLAEQLTISRDDLTPPAPQVSFNTESRRPAEQRRKRTTIKDVGDGQSVPLGTARADQIMDILKLGNALAIKDIAANLPQYSEKMVQRELADLVRVQRIRKIGAKRWSKYEVVL